MYLVGGCTWTLVSVLAAEYMSCSRWMNLHSNLLFSNNSKKTTLIVTSAIRSCSVTNTQRVFLSIILTGALWIESFVCGVARPGF